MEYKYICPFCKYTYVAENDEDEKFETFECPQCSSEVQFCCNVKGDDK